jgi:hypothetical protein
MFLKAVILGLAPLARGQDKAADAQEATLCFLVWNTAPKEILIGLKKVGFGTGKYGGFG